MKSLLLFQAFMGNDAPLLEIKGRNWWCWSRVSISAEDGNLIDSRCKNKCALYASVQAKVEQLPFVCMQIQPFDFLWSLKGACIPSKYIQILPPFNCVASASLDIQTRHHFPYIPFQWVSLAGAKNGLLILSEVTPTYHPNSLLEQGRSMSVSGLVHSRHLLYCMLSGWVQVDIRGDIIERKIDPSWNEKLPVLKFEHGAEIVRLEVQRNRELVDGSIGHTYLCKKILALTDITKQVVQVLFFLLLYRRN